MPVPPGASPSSRALNTTTSDDADQAPERITMPRHIVRDDRLTWAARGLLTTIAAYLPDRILKQGELLAHAKDGEHATRTAMRLLIELGYIERRRVQGDWEYRVNLAPRGEERP